MKQDDPKILLRQMLIIRAVEERLLELFSKGLISGTVHTCIGQEACAVGLLSAIDKDKDIIFSNHRGHGHYIAYCDDLIGLIGEVLGHSKGVCRGIGGSQHLQIRNFYTNGIQGAGAPIAVGMALAEKNKRTGAIAVVNLGDGTFGEGAVYEAMNVASLWHVPVIFSVEHNHYAQTTPTSSQHAGSLPDRARMFGIEVLEVDGMDVIQVASAARIVANNARRENRPQVLFMDTYRFAPHSKGDDYRDKGELTRNLSNDPITRLVNAATLHNCFQELREQAALRVDKTINELLEGQT